MHKVTIVRAKRLMPKISSKLGYACPICGLDYGWEETVVQKSTRKRGLKNKLHALSKRRTDDEKIHLTKIASKPAEYGLYNLITDHLERGWLDVAANGFVKLLHDGTWNRMSVHDQESILKGIARVKARVDSRKKGEQEEEENYKGWDVVLTEKDSPFYELSRKITGLYKSSISKTGNNGTARFNPVIEIERYRRAGDPLRHLYVDEDRQTRVLFKYPSLMKKFKDEGKDPLIQKGSVFLNKYRQPFSDARWRYLWIEHFWIALYAHVVSPRQGARMVGILDGQVGGKISPKYIKDRIQPAIEFWCNFFEFVPHYLRYLVTIESIIKNDSQLSKIDQLESKKCDRENENDIEEIGRTHLEQVLKLKSTSGGTLNDANTTLRMDRADLPFDIRVPKVGREMIRIRHPNINFQREMDEYTKGIRKVKPKRKTSSCYFDPWKQSTDVKEQLLKKGKIYLFSSISRSRKT